MAAPLPQTSPAGVPTSGGLGSTNHSGPAPQAQPPPQPPTTLTSPTKEVNTAQLCRIGQDFVHEVVCKASEIFVLLKNIQWPNGLPGNQSQAYQDSKAKLDENLKQMTLNFRRLRMVYNKVHENTVALDTRPVEELLPLEVDGELKGEGPRVTDTVKYASEEHKEVIAQLQARNRELKDIIDKLRMTVWEINTMIATRKS